ncbi:MAG TPA: dTDP-4-dehydrorhamnose 3,5-epimerase [Gammaproteobacteria bacterium]|nr:dTDP-4-dehydrorhamnose 3,5-epimerase [Gammaproteobacteria bacterium]
MKLPGLLLIEPQVFKDPRGFFLETHNLRNYLAKGISTSFVQDNISRSVKGVLRGLHYQLEHPQAKLVSVIRGAVLDVVVDIRRGSPTFGQWQGVELSDENHLQLFIPEGFAHGFSVLSEEVDFLYKCSDYYHPESEFGIRWDDPNINISWQNSEPILSQKDKAYPLLSEVVPEHLPKF